MFADQRVRLARELKTGLAGFGDIVRREWGNDADERCIGSAVHHHVRNGIKLRAEFARDRLLTLVIPINDYTAPAGLFDHVFVGRNSAAGWEIDLNDARGKRFPSRARKAPLWGMRRAPVTAAAEITDEQIQCPA